MFLLFFVVVCGVLLLSVLCVFVVFCCFLWCFVSLLLIILFFCCFCVCFLFWFFVGCLVFYCWFLLFFCCFFGFLLVFGYLRQDLFPLKCSCRVP